MSLMVIEQGAPEVALGLRGRRGRRRERRRQEGLGGILRLVSYQCLSLSTCKAMCTLGQ
jgi:hypothetical protein